MALVRRSSMAHRTLDRLAQGPARNRDIAVVLDRETDQTRKLLKRMIRRGLAHMAQARIGEGNPFAIYEITEVGRVELRRLESAERVWGMAA